MNRNHYPLEPFSTLLNSTLAEEFRAGLTSAEPKNLWSAGDVPFGRRAAWLFGETHGVTCHFFRQAGCMYMTAVELAFQLGGGTKVDVHNL